MSSYNGVMTYNMTNDIPRLGNGLSFCHWTYCVYLTMNVLQLDVYNYYVVNHLSHYHYFFIPSFFYLTLNDEHSQKTFHKNILSVLGTYDDVQ